MLGDDLEAAWSLMFTDWPEEKRELEAQIQLALRRRVRAHAPVAFTFPRFMVHEGHRILLVSSQGVEDEMNMKELHSSSQVDTERFRNEGARVLPPLLDNLARDAAAAIETDMFEVLTNAPPSVGGKFRGETAEELLEQLLQTMDQMDFGFDQNGQPTTFIAMHPDSWSKYAEDFNKVQERPEFRARYEAIVERKRNEWFVREGHRRLAD